MLIVRRPKLYYTTSGIITPTLQHYTKAYGIQTTGIYCCCLYAISLGIVFYVHGSMHHELNSITVQQDATYSVYYISVGSSTCFGC